jgi:hypothetical protein
MKQAFMIAVILLIMIGCGKEAPLPVMSSEIRRSMGPVEVVKAFVQALPDQDYYVLSHTTNSTVLYRDTALKKQILDTTQKATSSKWKEVFVKHGKAMVTLTVKENNGTVMEKSFYLSEVARGQNKVYSWKIDRFY